MPRKDVSLTSARAPRRQVPPAKTAKIRRLYEAGQLSQAEIARRYLVSPSTVGRLARRGLWRRDASRAELVGRIRTRVDAELVEVERAMGSEGRSTDSVERSARTLASLAKTLRELVRIDDELSRGGTAEDADEPHDDIADLDGFRRALAERLERLNAERTP